MNPIESFGPAWRADENESAANAFARAVRILTPLVVDAVRDAEEASDVESRLMVSVERLRRASDSAREAIELPDDNPAGNELTAALAHLVAIHGDENIDQAAIAAVISAALEMMDTLPDAPEIEDSLGLAVKSALFAPVVRLSHSLESLGLPDDAVRAEVRVIAECAVQLSATLAFQWAKKSGVDDAREKLFITVLPATLSLTEQAWLESAQENLPEHPWDPALAPARRYPNLLAAIRELDMGWVESESGLEALMERLANRLDAGVAWRMRDHWPAGFRDRMAASLASTLEARAITAWSSAADALTAEVEAMDEETFARFAEGEGAEPMRLERFDRAFQLESEGSPTLEPPTVNPEDVIRRARKKLAFLWGVSDAACQTRLVSK